jgi:Immunity protein 53
MTTLNWLQIWYQRACNGTWEHSYGITIDTLDNPGWHMHIDLAGTPYANAVARQTSVENSETDWLRCSIEGDQFEGYGDPKKLEQIIQVFKDWIEPVVV